MHTSCASFESIPQTMEATKSLFPAMAKCIKNLDSSEDESLIKNVLSELDKVDGEFWSLRLFLLRSCVTIDAECQSWRWQNVVELALWFIGMVLQARRQTEAGKRCAPTRPDSSLFHNTSQCNRVICCCSLRLPRCLEGEPGTVPLWRANDLGRLLPGPEAVPHEHQPSTFQEHGHPTGDGTPA